MGRGSSKTGAGYNRVRPNGLGQFGGLSRNVATGDGASFNTVSTVAAIEATRDDPNRVWMTQQFDGVRDGQKVAFYSEEYESSSRRRIEGTAEDLVVWTKRDNEWKSDDGRTRTSSEMTREVVNTPRKIGAGNVNTESHVDVPESGGRTINGLRYVGGTYDIQVNGATYGASGMRKMERKGNVTTYNGTMYGVTKDGGTYNITHVPTGLSIMGRGDRVTSMKQASDYIRRMDATVKGIRGLDDMQKRFNKTIRLD